MVHLSWALGLLPLVFAAPGAKRAVGPVVQLSGGATVVGSTSGTVDSFKGVPFAQPPVGQLRLKPPQALATQTGTILAVGEPTACPQFETQVQEGSLGSALGLLLNTPIAQTVQATGEDCLTINIQRPSTATSSSKLPVLFWIYGGGFEFGSTQTYDGSELISTSITQGKDIIYVAVNYRLGGFGFLPGKEILADGSSNLGLLDQRLALQWVADNIAAFGGDPTKVTIWGESAGSISVFDQMALYGGNYTYKGQPLFRAGIMDSGSIVPANPVDAPRAQAVYDSVVSAAGCSSSADTLNCLRGLSYEKYLDAANSVPGIFGYNGIALSYLPRPDGTVLPASPEVLAANGQYAPIPFIVGDQQDEGTLFSLSQNNISTSDELVTYLNSIVFQDATRAQVQGLVDTYPDNAAAGSPYNTGDLNNIYPEYKRLAALQGDFVFILTRRAFLSLTSVAMPNIPSWSYLATYFYGTPVLGTFHASDIIPAYGIIPSFASNTIQSYYLSFVNTLNPNTGTTSSLPSWPQWSNGNELVQFGATNNTYVADTFRNSSYQYLNAHIANFHI